jgi:type II secretory pathway pseudopilin PulG
VDTAWIVLISVLAVIAVVAAVFLVVFLRRRGAGAGAELEKKNLETLVEYVKAQQAEAEQKQRIKDLKTAEQREKLEKFKRTKDELKLRLKSQLDAKEWTPVNQILSGLDKGTVGVYVLFNETKNKYYVGQSKELFTRIKKHFEIEPIALDFINGDVIRVKTLTAAELGTEYRIDHIEKTGIELFDAAGSGYNKTAGNM